MKILFISRFYFPHIGGVEKHIDKISENLRRKDHEVTILTSKFSRDVKKKEVVKGIKVIRIQFPRIKLLGLLCLWYQLWLKRELIKEADIVHVHDVFIWYLPFRVLFPSKRVYTTFHGGQDVWPVPLLHKLLVKLASLLSTGSIAVGDFIGKYYGIKPDITIYGAVEQRKLKKKAKIPNSAVWVGRLEKSTGVLDFIGWAKKRKLEITFLGDGPLRGICDKYGEVKGFVVNPFPFIEKASVCAPVGYLSFLEAREVGCAIKTFADTPIKKDYWRGIKRLKSVPTWKQLSEVYLRLWK